MPVRVGVVGVGYLGTFHAEKYRVLPGARLMGVHDIDVERGQRLAESLGVAFHRRLETLVDAVEALSIAVPTVHHHAIAHDCLARGRHCLLEKPIAETVAQAGELVRLARRHGVVLQVGHLERFNPVLGLLATGGGQVRHIQTVRHGPCRQRGLDVDVVLDLMIHDIDIVLSLHPGPVTVLGATGAAVLGPHWDVASAQLRFADGSSAQLSASRLAEATERWIRVHERGRYLCLDYTGQTLSIHHCEVRDGFPVQRVETMGGQREDLLRLQLQHFLACVRSGEPPRVGGEAALRALAVAGRIRQCLRGTVRDGHHPGVVVGPVAQPGGDAAALD